MDAYKKGILLAAIASILVGIETIITKFAYNESDFPTILVTRGLTIVLLTAVYIIATNKSFKLERENYSTMFIVSIFSIISSFLFIYALREVPAINASLLANIQPIFVIIAGFIILGKSGNLKKSSYMAITLMVIAGVLITSKSLTNILGLNLGSIGDLLIIFSVLASGTSDVLVKKN